MMKRFLLSVLILQTIFFIGCSEIDNQSTPSEDSEEEIIVSDSEETDISNEMDQSIYAKLNRKYDLENKEEVYIRKINEEKFLVGFQEKFAYQMNPMFHIYNLSTNDSPTIDGTLDYIDEIRIENDQIEFYSKGTNIINGFKRFPNITNVDIKTGFTENNTVFSRLGSDYKPYYMGNFMNETKLNALEIIEGKIIFDFSVTENAILAGGDHCPNIEVISESNNSLSVDIENLVLNEKDLAGIEANSLFQEIKINSYTDGRNIKHSVLNFVIEEYSEYTCRFITGDDGIRDLVIELK